MVKKIINEIIEGIDDSQSFYKDNARLICYYLVQYIAYEQDKSLEELSNPTIYAELKAIDKMLNEEKLPIRIFLLISQKYINNYIDMIGEEQERVDFSFVIDQSESLAQSSYLLLSRVVQTLTIDKDLVPISTMGFMNDKVREISTKYKNQVKKYREENM